MDNNRFWKIIIVFSLYIPTYYFVFKQLILTGNSYEMFLDYLGAIGWAIFITFLIILIYNKSHNLKYTVMNKWTKKVPSSFLNRHYSNTFERIVTMKGGVPIKVVPKGMFWVGLITDYDELALIDLRPKLISVKFNEDDQISTVDGVKIFGTIDLTIKVLEKENYFFRLISNEEEEEKRLYSFIKQAVRKILSDKDWIDLSILKSDKYEDIKKLILKDMHVFDSCLNIAEIMFINLSPIDKDFINFLEQSRKEKEHANLKEAKEKIQQKIIKLEHETEFIKLEHERIKETQETEHNIQVTALKSEADINQKNKEHEAELNRKRLENDEKVRLFEKQAELLTKYPIILAEINLAAFEKVNEKELKELELKLEKEKESSEFMKRVTLKTFDTNLAETKGQIGVLRAFAAKHFNLTLTTTSEDAQSENTGPNHDQSINDKEGTKQKLDDEPIS